jgi:hypothetical protein
VVFQKQEHLGKLQQNKCGGIRDRNKEGQIWVYIYFDS